MYKNFCSATTWYNQIADANIVIMNSHSSKIQKHPMLVGLTGGIGAGKTTVAKFFQQLGVIVIDADEIAHQITQPNQAAYNKIVAHFGIAILTPDKKIDRKKLRHIIFNDLSQKQWLENLLHPIIIEIMQQQASKIKAPYIILAIPLLTEAKDQLQFLDRILVVDAPIHTQIVRASTRDQSNATDIEAIVDAQVERQHRLAIADDIIVNDSDLVSLENKVGELHQKYLALCKVY